MKRSVLIVLLLTLAVPCLAFGQAQTAPPPKPGPEAQRLGYFVGTWKFEGETLLDPKGKYGGTMTFEWFPGGLSVVGKGEGVGVSGGPMNELGILGYNATEKVYSWYTVTRSGAGQTVRKWTVNGPVWTCESESTVGGKPAKYRYTITEVPPLTYTYKVERSVEGGPWTQTIDLKATKVK
jgi:hypothetical protein